MKIDHLCHENIGFQANIHFSEPNPIRDFFPFRILIHRITNFDINKSQSSVDRFCSTWT